MKRTYPAEAFDAMQYFYGAAHEPQIHCLIRLSGHLDEAVLRRAVTLSAGALPMIFCAFDASGMRARWRAQNFSGNDVVLVHPALPGRQAQEARLLASVIDVSRGPQVLLHVIRDAAADTLCAVISHLLCDGAGFKEYLYLLADLYAQCLAGQSPKPVFLPRDAGALFKGPPGKLKILSLPYDASIQRLQMSFALQGEAGRPIFTAASLCPEEFRALKAHTNACGVTVNDILLAAYISVLHRETGWPRVIMPCPADLRKYLQSGRKQGICNLTGNFLCDVRTGEGFEGILRQVSQQMSRQKNSAACLKPVLLLLMAYRLLPLHLMEKLFHKTFRIPLLSYTNLGLLDPERLRFGGTAAAEAYLSGAVKRAPYFQVSVSTFCDACTLSCNLYGTIEDEARIHRILEGIRSELISQIA